MDYFFLFLSILLISQYFHQFHNQITKLIKFYQISYEFLDFLDEDPILHMVVSISLQMVY